MANRCRTCRHSARNEIDVKLVRGGAAQAIAIEYDLNPRAVQRHAETHIPKVLQKARDAVHMAEGDRLLAELRNLHDVTLSIIAESLAARDDPPDEVGPSAIDMMLAAKGLPVPPPRPSIPPRARREDRLVALKAIGEARKNIELLLKVAGAVELAETRERRHA